MSDGHGTATRPTAVVGPTARRPPWESERPTIRWGAYAWALVGFGLAFVLIWRGLGYVRIVVVPLTLAVFPAAVLTPVARWLEDRGFPPAAAAFTVLSLFVALLAGLGVLLTVQIQGQLEGLVDQMRSAYEQLEERASSLPFLPEPASLFGGGNGGSGGDSGGSPVGAQTAMAALAGLGRFVTEFLLFLVATFFYVKDRDQLAGWLRHLFPRSRQGDAENIGGRIWESVSGYIRGQAIVAMVDGVLVAVGLWIAGIPLAAALGGLVFVGAFAPVVGSIVAGAVAVLVALVTKGFASALIALAIVVAVQQIEGNVLAPIVLGRELRLHPLVVLGAITAGAVLLGPFGAVVAVPLAASIHRAASYVRHEAAAGAASSPG